MSESAAGVPDGQLVVKYSFRRAHETNAFHQFPLITPSKLRSEARNRGIKSSFIPTFEAELERFEREGAFSPILFETVDANGAETIVFRDDPGSEPARLVGLAA